MAGTNWHLEVGRVDAHDPEIVKKRQEFYRAWAQRKLLKLRTDTRLPALSTIIKDPKEYGFQNFEGLKKIRPFKKEFPRREKYDPSKSLGETLKEFFRANLTGENAEKQVEQETYLTLFYLSNKAKDKDGRRINVDLILQGETLEITDGRLYIYTQNAKGEKKYRINGAPLRPTGEKPEQPTAREIKSTPPTNRLLPKEPERSEPDVDRMIDEAILTEITTETAPNNIRSQLRLLISSLTDVTGKTEPPSERTELFTITQKLTDSINYAETLVAQVLNLKRSIDVKIAKYKSIKTTQPEKWQETSALELLLNKFEHASRILDLLIKTLGQKDVLLETARMPADTGILQILYACRHYLTRRDFKAIDELNRTLISIKTESLNGILREIVRFVTQK